MSTPIKFLLIVGLTITLLLSIIHFSYKNGYDAAESKYKLMLNEFSLRAEKLRVTEEVIKQEVVTQYKDRVQTITEYRTELIEKTPDALKIEETQCKIGPEFIRLHNASAIGK